MNATHLRPRAKRTQAQRESDLAEISARRLAGETQAQIAEALAASRPYRISRRQVGHDIALLEGRWRESALSDLVAAKGQELARLAKLEAEAWEGWERSQADRVRVEESDKGTRTVREGQAGDSSFLARILDAINRRCAILGLDAPTRQQVSGTLSTGPGVVVELPCNGRDQPDYSRLNDRELSVFSYLIRKLEAQPDPAANVERELAPVLAWISDPLATPGCARPFPELCRQPDAPSESVETPK